MIDQSLPAVKLIIPLGRHVHLAIVDGAAVPLPRLVGAATGEAIAPVTTQGGYFRSQLAGFMPHTVMGWLERLLWFLGNPDLPLDNETLAVRIAAKLMADYAGLADSQAVEAMLAVDLVCERREVAPGVCELEVMR